MILEDMTDVCGGKMNLGELQKEVARYMHYYSPTRLVIDIEREEEGYITTIYIPTKEFKRGIKI